MSDEYPKEKDCKRGKIIINAGNNGQSSFRPGVPVALAGMALGAILVRSFVVNHGNTVTRNLTASLMGSAFDNDITSTEFECDKSIKTPVNVCNNICIYQKDNDGKGSGGKYLAGSENSGLSVQRNATGSTTMSNSGRAHASQGPAGQITSGRENNAGATDPSGSTISGNIIEENASNQVSAAGEVTDNQTNVIAGAEVTIGSE